VCVASAKNKFAELRAQTEFSLGESRASRRENDDDPETQGHYRWSLLVPMKPPVKFQLENSAKHAQEYYYKFQSG